MARFKRAARQTSFRFMEVRKELLEADDTDIRQASLWSARNMRGRSTGTLSARPGLRFERAVNSADLAVEIEPVSGQKFALLIDTGSVEIIDDRGRLVHTITSVPWSETSTLWVEPFRRDTVIGGPFGIYTLEYDEGVWSLDRFAFAEAPGGELAQPYWAYEKNVQITPSALTGEIQITATSPIWKAGHVGLRIRYLQREILITGLVSSSVLSGVVIDSLPPTFEITVSSTAGFRTGEAVVGADSNYQGVVTGISGNILQVTTLNVFAGPDVSEVITSTSGASTVTSFIKGSPGASGVWDEPLMSDLRGWPRAASVVSGRLLLVDFPQVPDMITLSSSRSIFDFDVGADDDDAIARQAGDNAPQWRHAVNMGDVLLLADNGLYYIPTRESGVLTPSTFNTVFVDNTGASTIRPIKVEDGVIFVNAGGENISAALLDGNIYLKWSVRSMTEYHSHLIKTPTRLCGPSLTSGNADKYVFVINSDGTLAALTWQESIRDEQIGFAPWDTEGSFVGVYPLFDGYWAFVDRTVNGSTARYLERFDEEAYLDCSVKASGESAFSSLEMNGETLQMNGEDLQVTTPFLAHLAGSTVTVYADGWDAGDFVVNSDGTTVSALSVPGTFEAGLNFTADAKPWPVENLDAGRAGTFTARVIQTFVSVQDTIRFRGVMNGYARAIGDYDFGDDISQPPQPRTRVYRFSVFGNRDHPEMIFEKDRPGPFNVLAIGQEVQA